MLTELTKSPLDRHLTPSRADHRSRLRTAGLLLSGLIASVWLYHGLYNKLLSGEPRHQLIVQSVPGLQGWVGAWTLTAVGVAEVLLAVWVIAGFNLRLCAAVQTIFLLAMNVIELVWAREHLLWPAGLIPANLLFLGLVWLSVELRRQGARPPRVGLHLLRRHPLVIDAFFRHSLVLTYAFPRHVLEPLLPPGLELDTYDDFGFVAVAMVQTQGLRPAGLPPFLGQSFVLTGYRIFTKFRTADGRTLRGLRILRSDTNRRMMVVSGNLLTHYNYRKCAATVRQEDDRLHIEIRTPGGEADVDVTADLSPAASGVLPEGSPLRTMNDARRFAGPLPWTFDYERETHSIIAIKGVRENWSPRLVPVDVRRLDFLSHAPFAGAQGILASAFYVHDIPYRWERGVRHQLPKEPS